MSENRDDLTLQVLNGNTDLAFKLFKILAQKDENLFFSPLSIYISLAMVCQGAKTSTAEILLETLQLPDAETAGRGYREMMQRFKPIQDITLTLANKILVKEGLTLHEEFKSAVVDSFNSEVEAVDFDDVEVAVEKVNDWVKTQTRGKIQEIIEKDDVDESLALVLLNAIYFHGGWRFEFDEANTEPEDFYVSEVEVIQVQMMHMDAVVPKYDCFREGLRLSAIELPYGNSDLSMILILPMGKEEPLVEFEKKLSREVLTEIVDNLTRDITVEVSVPKFILEQAIDLKESLTTLGLGELFTWGAADLSGTVEEKNLFVGKMKQKAFIEVNEKGCTAAAVTESLLVYLSFNIFCCNRPFFFFIVQKAVAVTPIFAGKVVRPPQA